MTPQEFRDIVYGFQTSRILLTSLELEIFTVINDGAKSSEDVSKVISSDIKATDRLMNALCALNFLEKSDGKFSNTNFTSKFLVKGKPDYISNLMHAVNLWDSWSSLTSIVRDGKGTSKVTSGSKNWLENFIEAMHYRALKQVPGDIDMLDLTNVHSVLDFGGGSGAYSIGFVRAKKDIAAVVFDLSDVVPLTQKYISNAGLQDKIKTVKGNYLLDDLGSGYDLIFLSAIVHSNSFDENKKLIRKCADALNEGGQIVIQDYAMNEERTLPASGAFFALNMLVNTQGGDTYTEKEIYSWLLNAGLKNIKRNETTHGAAQIIGRK